NAAAPASLLISRWSNEFVGIPGRATRGAGAGASYMPWIKVQGLSPGVRSAQLGEHALAEEHGSVKRGMRFLRDAHAYAAKPHAFGIPDRPDAFGHPKPREERLELSVLGNFSDLRCLLARPDREWRRRVHGPRSGGRRSGVGGRRSEVGGRRSEV